MSVRRVYVVKREEHGVEAKGLLNALRESLGIEQLNGLKILNRYDIEGLSEKELEPILNTVFAEPMVDDLYLETYPFDDKDIFFAVEYLPGQYDQRSDSAEQCAMVMTGIGNIRVHCAKVYILSGNLQPHHIESVKNYIINKVDQREAAFEKPATLEIKSPVPDAVAEIDGFTDLKDEELGEFIGKWGLAMSKDDLKTVRSYFSHEEKRNPTETEIRLLDTYWSDHCRHTTFNTVLTDIKVSDGNYKNVFESALQKYFLLRQDVYGDNVSQKPVSLMDMAVINAKYAKKHGFLDNLELSEENNACSIEVDIETDEGPQRWLLQFKNETHNHPTEIEPYGGAATCLGGAIRDPLSGRAYVYHAMRITGSGNPLEPVADTLAGKLAQRKITREAARGFSSYGNQIGLATGYVQEFYHDGFKAKRLEAGAVIGAVPKDWVRRETPVAGDIIILVGGRTGRDGIGGATGSSKEHDLHSIEVCGAEVQKGNAPEEHKIQRLFRKEEVSRMIKKCNDFGAGGVGVAIGELADGLMIDLNAVPKKYDGLSGTEIAISESQERMAVVVAASDSDRFIEECNKENLEATVVAEVTDNRRLRMRHDGRLIVDISRDFLDTSGAARYQNVVIENPSEVSPLKNYPKFGTFKETAENILSNLSVCSQKGMVEMFDSTIGGGSVLMPFGGKTGNTPSEYMAAKFPVLGTDTISISVMASGYNPYISCWSPFHGGMYAVFESVAKVVASGAKLSDIRLSLQEYFERLENEPSKWGKPAAALLGAMTVQDRLSLGAIGGKDSMSGTFKDKDTGKNINVPPTLISFAVAPSLATRVTTAEFKGAGRNIYLVKTNIDGNNIPDFEMFKENAASIYKMAEDRVIDAIYTVNSGGIVEALSKMAFGNMVAFSIENIALEELAAPYYGSFIVSSKEHFDLSGVKNVTHIGKTIDGENVIYGNESVPLSELLAVWKSPLESIFPSSAKSTGGVLKVHDYDKRSNLKFTGDYGKPSIAMLALPGVNCEYDMKRIFELSGSRLVEPFIFRNRTVDEAEESCRLFAELIKKSQILALPGGFSAGDEPEGSGKFFVSVFKNSHIRDAVSDLLENRDGLVIGICNGFQALIKTGLLTRGKICDLEKDDATLSFNTIGRHVSQMVRLRTSSLNSPWMALKNIGDIDMVPVSHGEGRFTASQKVIEKLFENGQVLFQYADINGCPTLEAPYNPNGSDFAIEGICSPCGRVLGKMGHSERIGSNVHINCAYGNFDQKIFKAGVNYFTGKQD